MSSRTRLLVLAKRLRLAEDTVQLRSVAVTALSLQVLFLAAAGKVCASHLPSKQNNIIAGVYVANRERDIAELATLPMSAIDPVRLSSMRVC